MTMRDCVLSAVHSSICQMRCFHLILERATRGQCAALKAFALLLSRLITAQRGTKRERESIYFCTARSLDGAVQSISGLSDACNSSRRDVRWTRAMSGRTRWPLERKPTVRPSPPKRTQVRALSLCRSKWMRGPVFYPFLLFRAQISPLMPLFMCKARDERNILMLFGKGIHRIVTLALSWCLMSWLHFDLMPVFQNDFLV